MPDDHDPFNDPEARHPRARQLMVDEALWDCVSDAAPFGSDEGNTAYFEFRAWRADHPDANLVECIDWILQGKLDRYTEQLLDDDRIAKLVSGDETESIDLGYADAFTLDATMIATALAQLADEGRVDPEAKPYVRVALRRQLHPTVVAQWQRHADERRRLLEEAARAIEAA